jgi:hypothetical protein
MCVIPAEAPPGFIFSSSPAFPPTGETAGRGRGYQYLMEG